MSYLIPARMLKLFVRHDWVPLNYDYKYGMTVLSPKIEEAFGAKNSPLAYGVLYELIGVDETLPFPGQQISSFFYS
jgi:hypothetical protein